MTDKCEERAGKLWVTGATAYEYISKIRASPSHQKPAVCKRYENETSAPAPHGASHLARTTILERVIWCHP